MPTMRIAFLAAFLAAPLAAACGGASAQSPAQSSPSAGKSTLPSCHWAPVKPDTEERCTLTSKGAQINITQRDSMRAQDQKTITVTCVCE
jgi:hypothetical protein